MGRCKENADRGRGGEDAEDDQTEPVDHLRDGGFCILYFVFCILYFDQTEPVDHLRGFGTATFFASSSKNIELAISANLVIFISPPQKTAFLFIAHIQKKRMKS